MNVNYTIASLERRSTRKIHLPEERFIANQGAHELMRGSVNALRLRRRRRNVSSTFSRMKNSHPDETVSFNSTGGEAPSINRD